MFDPASKLRAVTKSAPCPVCQGDHKCSVSDDGLVLCGRHSAVEPGFRLIGPCEDPTWTMYRPADPGYDDIMAAIKHGGVAVKPRTAYVPPPDFERMADGFADRLTAERKLELAGLLGLPVGCLAALPKLGYDPDQRAFTFPECDSRGCVIGLTVRYPDGTKRCKPGSRRGLTLADGWFDGDSPIYVVEGASDTLALAALGLAVIGRPSAAGGVELLGNILARSGKPRPVFVVGENDRKEDGSWPGRDGCARVAEALAGRLPDWSISAAMPALEYKDVREWIKIRIPPNASAELLKTIGRDVAFTLGRNSNPFAAPTKKAKPAPTRFPLPVPLGSLETPAGGRVPWVWDGFLGRGSVTLLSALPKAGKTTLLAALLKQLGTGGTFAGRPLAAGRAVVVSEEGTGVWACRRDELGIGDHVRLITRPFFGKPSAEDWLAFLTFLGEQLEADPADLIVLDTLADLWPVRDENNATDVQTALQPLRRLADDRAVLLVHHLRKSDGAEGRVAGERGVGGFVDVLAELRRAKASQDPSGRRRRLSAVGRFDGVPREWLVERSADGRTFAGEDGSADQGAERRNGAESRTEALREAISSDDAARTAGADAGGDLGATAGGAPEERGAVPVVYGGGSGSALGEDEAAGTGRRVRVLADRGMIGDVR